MAYHALVKKSVANTVAGLTEIKDAVVTGMGWTLHDDQSGESPPYYVFKSEGENADRFPVYVKYQQSTTADRYEIFLYLNWNNANHTGTVKIGSANYIWIYADDDTAFTIWVYGDKDGFAVISKVGADYRCHGVDYLDSYYKAFGTLVSGVSAGSDIVLQLGTGEADDFVVGESYQVVGTGEGEGRERPEIINVDTTNHRVTVDNLARGLSAGSAIARIGYLWVLTRYSDTSRAHVLDPSVEGTADYSAAATKHQVAQLGDFDPNSVTDNYDMWFNFLGKTGGLYGFFSRLPRMNVSTGNEDTVAIEQEDTGTSTGSNTSTTLNDTGKSWTINEWTDYCLIITSGTNAGEMRKIVSNTATELTVDAAWTVTPDATSGYAIAKKGYRYFNFSDQGHAFKEIDEGV